MELDYEGSVVTLIVWIRVIEVGRLTLNVVSWLPKGCPGLKGENNLNSTIHRSQLPDCGYNVNSGLK